MSAYNCLKAKIAAGKVSKHKGKAAAQRIKEIRDALIKQGETPGIAQSMAELRYAEELDFKAVNQKWRLINRVRVQRDLQAAVSATDASKLGKMAVKMVDDADFEARSVHKQIMGRVGSFLEKHRVTLKGDISNPANFREFMKGLMGEPTNDATAKALADAVGNVNEYIRKKLNSYGYSIGKLDGWALPHSHNALTIGGTPFRQWANDIDAQLDWAGMVNPKTGLEFTAVPPQAYRDEFLQAAYDNIVYGRNSKNPQWNTSAEGNVLERHRVFKFKNSDGWIAYNDKYGSADPHSTLLQHWDQMARHIALARRFGPTADTAVDYLGQLIAQKNRDTGAGAVTALKGQGGTALAKGMLRVMEGGIGPNGWAGAQSARFFSTARKVMTSAMLDRAIVISVPSDMNSIRIAAQSIGMNQSGWFNTYTNLLKDAAQGGGATRADLLRAQHIAESWANPGVTTSRFQAEYPSAAWAEKLSNASMRIQGMNAHTDSGKLAFSWGMAGQMASDASKPFDQLNPYMQRAMSDAGIKPADWDIFRAGPKFTASNGAEFLSPLYWQSAYQGEPVEGDRIFMAFQSFVEKWTELAVPSRSLIAQGIMDPKAYNLAPGGALYELVKSAGMFKSFVGAFVVNQARLYGHMPTVGAKAGYVMQMLGTTTLVGALAIQIGDLLMGRDPQDMTQGSFWWRSMLRGGGLGPAGDLLATGATSWGSGLSGYVAGPVVGFASDVNKLTFGNVVQAYQQAIDGDDIDIDLMKEIMDFQRRYTPMWQTPLAAGGAALDRLISDQMVLLLDPGAIDGMVKNAQRRENFYGGGTFWMPGSPLPARPPNLGTAIGR
jgi:hypothetical protein